MNPKSQLEYINHIDTYRALAVLIVVLFHLDVPGFFGGFLGVDIFFVISGYLISRLIKHEYDSTGTFLFGKFYMKRVRRLLPSLFLMIGFSFFLSLLFFTPLDFINAAQSMYTAAIALSNFYFLGETGYFEISAKLKPVLHTWSLAIEEQFYLIWPLLFLSILKYSTRKILILLSLFIVSFFLTIYVNLFNLPDDIIHYFTPEDDLISNTQSIQFYLLPFRAYEFLLGAILIYIPKFQFKNQLLNTSLHIIGLLLIFLSSFFLSKETNFISTLNLIPCIGIGILLVVPPGILFKRIYHIPFLQLIGKASYTWYLFHWPIIVFYYYFIDRPFHFHEKAALFLISLGISLFIYRFYETPLRYYGLDKRKKMINRAYIGFILLSIIALFFAQRNITRSNGWQWRVKSENIELAEDNSQNSENPLDYRKNNIGHNETSKNGITLNNWIGHSEDDPPAAADMIWFGDSHVGHYTYGIDAILVNQYNKRVYSSMYSCLMLPDVIPSNSLMKAPALKRYNDILSLIERNPNVTVAISFYWVFQLGKSYIKSTSGGNYTKPTFDLNSPQSYQFLVDQIDKFHRVIQNKKLIVIGGSPSNPQRVNSNALFKQDIASYQLNKYLQSAIANKPNLLFINPSSPFCRNQKCVSQKNGPPFFVDSNHLSKSGSLEVIKYYEQEILGFMHK